MPRHFSFRKRGCGILFCSGVGSQPLIFSNDMRILFVNRMASMVRGGGETFDLEVASHLKRLGVETGFLSGRPLLGAARIQIKRPRSRTIRSPYLGWLPWDRLRGGWRLRALNFGCLSDAP